ncbi:Putative germin-like protein 2-1 [Linum grandiflorum]
MHTEVELYIELLLWLLPRLTHTANISSSSRLNNMDSKCVLLLLVVLASASSVALATDAPPLQDFCVADKEGIVPMNGFACKPPKLVTAEDFSFCGLDKPANASNAHGCGAALFTASQIPGLNTQGLSLVRIDFLKGGVNPPHIHPRASEVFVVMEGAIEVGFITSLPEIRVISKVVKAGEVFVFPSSQNPGTQPVFASVFGSHPKLAADILSKAIDIDEDIITQLQNKYK